MIRAKFAALLLFVFSCFFVHAHSGKARYHVIIETDGTQDDQWAISLLLASKEVEVMGIYYSGDELSADLDTRKIRFMLREYHHEGIDIGTDEVFIRKVYAAEDESVTYICLASLMTFINSIIPDHELKEKTGQLIWFQHPELSKEEAESLIQSDIPVEIIAQSMGKQILYTEGFYSGIHSRYANFMENSIHNNTKNIIQESLLAIWISKPGLFEQKSASYELMINYLAHENQDSLQLIYRAMLKEKKPDYKIFSSMPVSREDYASDISPYIQTIIDTHGMNEWRAGVLSCELHGHIGIYAIIGVKMGLRAREYFNIGLDDLQITSDAGTTPPFSCLNDGLQVSTGSTLGHGLITAQETEHPSVSAQFSFKNQCIEIALRDEISRQMKQDIKRAVDTYGYLTEEYWKFIRSLAIKYWIEFNKNEIFEITKI